MEHFGRLPATAAWRHGESREGFEVVFLAAGDDTIRIEGTVTVVLEAEPLWVGYSIELDARWATRRARLRGRSPAGARESVLEADGAGAWTVDGRAAPALDGCLDVDLEASAFTNAFPVHRMRLERGVVGDAPAAWVRARDLGVERLDQTYARVDDRRFDYACDRFGFRCRIVYDDAGLVTSYPQIASRVC